MFAATLDICHIRAEDVRMGQLFLKPSELPHLLGYKLVRSTLYCSHSQNMQEDIM